jgi:hypothetical protein
MQKSMLTLAAIAIQGKETEEILIIRAGLFRGFPNGDGSWPPPEQRVRVW